MTADNQKKGRSAWLTGCGIGCGILLLIGVVIVVGGTLFVRDTMTGFDTALETREQLDERFGPGDAFVPSPDGAIPADRIEAFLRVREHVAPQRHDLGDFFATIEISDQQARELEEASFWEKMRFTGRISKQAMSLPGSMARFFEARNRALLDEAMGFGEYTYIYVLVYYTWLGHSPAHGPDSVAIGVALDDEDTGEADQTAGTDETDAIVAPEVPPVPRPPSGRVPRRAHENLVGILRNQLAALDGAAPGSLPTGFSEALGAEIEAMERDRGRLLWEDGLPEPIAASLEPFRQQLADSYDPVANEFELLRNRKDGMSIRAE